MSAAQQAICAAPTCALMEMMPHGAGGFTPFALDPGIARCSLAICSAEYRMTSRKRASGATTSPAGNHLRSSETAPTRQWDLQDGEGLAQAADGQQKHTVSRWLVKGKYHDPGHHRKAVLTLTLTLLMTLS